MSGYKSLNPAPPIKIGTEDRFYYEISDDCVQCGVCSKVCPLHAILEEDGTYRVLHDACIDCGTCSMACPSGAARRVPYVRESITIEEIDRTKCCFNPGCALSLYKPDLLEKMLQLLQRSWGDVKLHSICCRHDPQLEAGTTIINNCAGCDRRFRSLYEGINTISYWEIIDSIADLPLPDHSGVIVSIHDSCGYRHKPQVHRAVRSLLRKMNIQIVEAEFSGTESVCCGDNLYGAVPNEQVEERIKVRTDQLPGDNVVVYCIGCVRAIFSGGKTPYYLSDLIFDRETEPMMDSLDEYHSRLAAFVETR